MTKKRRNREQTAQREAIHEREKREAIGRGEGVNVEALSTEPILPVPPDYVRRGYYVDQPYKCSLCGKPQVWTARQQKWWYEVAKGSVYSRAASCPPCRRWQKQGRAGTPPHLPPTNREILKQVRARIELVLHEAGYRRAAKPRGTIRNRDLVDFTRENDQLRLVCHRGETNQTIEIRLNETTHVTIAMTDSSQCRSAADLEARLTPMIESVRAFLIAHSTEKSRATEAAPEPPPSG